jgi:hypothetical protein
MLIFIILLIVAGAIGGLISYLVFFKGLRVPGDPAIGSASFGIEDSGFLANLFKFLKSHWELLAYLLMGMAGSLLVPLINEWVGGMKGMNNLRLEGTEDIEDYIAKLNAWQKLIIFDYGVVFGYSANRLFGGLTSALLSRIGSISQNPKTLEPPFVRADFGLESINLTLGQKVPNVSEKDPVASGPFHGAILRGTSHFSQLVENKNTKVVFKNEEGDGSDRLMTHELKSRIDLLADSVQSEWGSAVKLRVTEAWDDRGEHSSSRSLHYEGRAVDLTTSDLDRSKLARLGRLAVEAGFNWVYYENLLHIHASVRRV